MDADRLAALHQRVIAQHEYPGHVCPTERKLVEFVRGKLPLAESTRMEEHLSHCAACRDDAARLQAAAEWFRTHRDEVFAGLEGKAADEGIEPWASCLPRDLLDRFVADTLPHTARGARLRARIEAHLAGCESCRHRAQQARDTLAATVVVALAYLRDHAAPHEDGASLPDSGKPGTGVPPAAEQAHALLLAIQTMAVARGTGRRARAMPGYRGQADTPIAALCVDAEGALVLDAHDNPTSVRFDVIRAEVEADGHYVIDLITHDRTVWERPEAASTVRIELRHEHRRLVLPAQKIGADGRVTFVGDVPSGVGIREFPLAALSVTIATLP